LNDFGNQTDIFSTEFDDFFEAVDAVDNFHDVAYDEVNKFQSC
jgi:hypothetical protein